MNDINGAIRIKNTFNIPGNVISSPEVQLVVKEELVKQFSGGQIGDALLWKNEFNLPDSVMSTPEAQLAARRQQVGKAVELATAANLDHIPKASDGHVEAKMSAPTNEDGIVFALDDEGVRRGWS